MTLAIREHVSLAPFTTLRVGGPARFFFRAEEEWDVAASMAWAQSKGLEVFVLGGGSNLLVSDDGFEGLVLQVGLQGISIDGETATAKAGVDWDVFVSGCVKDNLAGIECLSGIPGLVGGTPVQNVGAYGQEVAETIMSVTCLDRHRGDIVSLSNKDCEFAYRSSIFNSISRDQFVVLSVTYGLRKGGRPTVLYKDLNRRLIDGEPSLVEVRDAVIAIRREKSMVIDPADPNSRSAGSFFKNPIVDGSVLAGLKSQNAEMPFFEFGDGFKIPAAWLIETAGFPRGFMLGSAGISSNHTLALINRGSAKAVDIIALKDLIQEGVAAKFGIHLEPEPVFLGFK